MVKFLHRGKYIQNVCSHLFLSNHESYEDSANHTEDAICIAFFIYWLIFLQKKHLLCVPQSHSIVWSTLTGSFDKDNLKCLLSVKHKCIKWISQEGSVFIMHSIALQYSWRQTYFRHFFCEKHFMCLNNPLDCLEPNGPFSCVISICKHTNAFKIWGTFC